jgi:septum formation protein
VASLPLVLASSSPRRAQLLRQIGIPFEVIVEPVDEQALSDELPLAYVERLARAKAAAVARPDRLVLAADTAVVVDGEILGKPRGRTEGVAMLLRLSGREHQVVTAVCVTDAPVARARVVTTQVEFGPIDEATAERYWATGEGADKAGGYGIQGIGGIFADRIAGSFSAVVGLPLGETEGLLRTFGFDTWRGRCDV